MAASSWRGATIFVRCFHISPLLIVDVLPRQKTILCIFMECHLVEIWWEGPQLHSPHTVSNSSPVLTSISTNICRIADSLLHLAEIAELNSGVCCTTVHGLPPHTVFKQFIDSLVVKVFLLVCTMQLWLWMYEVQRCPNWRTQVLTLRPTVWLDDKPVGIMCSENK